MKRKFISVLMATAIVASPLAPSYDFLINENTEAYADSENSEDPDAGKPDEFFGGGRTIEEKDYPDFGIKFNKLIVSAIPGENAKWLGIKKIDGNFLDEFFRNHRYEIKNRNGITGINIDLYKENGSTYTKEELMEYEKKVKEKYPGMDWVEIMHKDGYLLSFGIEISDKLIDYAGNEVIYSKKFEGEDFIRNANSTRGERYEGVNSYSYDSRKGVYKFEGRKADFIIGERSKPDLTETKAGVYKVNLSALSGSFRNSNSMAQGSIEKEGYLVISDNEKRLYVKFKPMDLMGQHGHLMNALSYKGLETKGEEPEPVKVEEVYKDGNYERYPGWISMKLENNDTTNSISCYKDVVVNVDIMLKDDGSFEKQMFTLEADYGKGKMVKENSTPDKIKELAEKVKKLDPNEYTSGVEELNSVAAESVRTAENGEATQDELNKAMANLIIAKSNLVEIQRKEQSAPKNIVGVAPTSKDGSDGKLIGLNPDKPYEYKKVSDKEYKKAPEHVSEITGLEAGKYDIRYAKDREFFESDSVWATVPEYEEKAEPVVKQGVKYEVPVKLMKAYEESDSMGNKALNPKAVVEEKDGKTYIYVSVEGMNLLNMRGHVTRLRVYPDGVSSSDANLTDAEVVEYKKDKGIDSIEKEFPSVFKITRDKRGENSIGVRINVDAMDRLSQGKDGSQPARLVLDWDKAVEIKEEEKPSDDKTPGGTDKPSDDKKPGGTDNPSDDKKDGNTDNKDSGSSTPSVLAGERGIVELIKLGDQIKDSKNFSRYTNSSVKIFEKSLERAKAVAADSKASDYAVIEAAVSLRFAIAQMEYSDKSELKNISASDKDYDSDRVYINGYKDGTFRPDKKVTRAEAAKILAYALTDISDKDGSGESSFNDIDNSAWYKKVVDFMESIDAVRGYNDGSFRPEKSISRAEFATIIANIDGHEANDFDKFKDVANSHWAKEYIEDVANKGYVKGYPDGTFKADETITRAEVVAIVNRMIGKDVDSFKTKDDLKLFKDMKKDHWAYWEVAAATNK